MAEEIYEEIEVPVRENGDDAEIRDTDIVFDCPHCGKNLVIDYRGAGLQINCSDGMELNDLDLDPGEILKQLFATRRNYQKAELKVQELKSRLVQLQETIGVMQEVIAEGIATS